jgi:hypothetical protein
MADDIEVTRRVEAAPAAVWSLVGDPTRIGAISPECERIEWLDGADGPAPGARFKGYNRKGLMRWTTTGTIVEHTPEREIVWDVELLGQSVARWGFRLLPEADGSATTVAQFWQDRRSPIANVVGRARAWDVPAHNRRGMEQTLETVQRAAESP